MVGLLLETFPYILSYWFNEAVGQLLHIPSTVNKGSLTAEWKAIESAATAWVARTVDFPRSTPASQPLRYSFAFIDYLSLI